MHSRTRVTLSQMQVAIDLVPLHGARQRGTARPAVVAACYASLVLRVGIVTTLALCGGCGQVAAPPDASVDATTDALGDANPFAAADVAADVSGPPDGSVRCALGNVFCDPATQYCRATGLVPPGNGACVALPSPCLADKTCACLADAGTPTCNDCALGDSGLLYVGCFDP
jgi:hypothetical protein